jgi:DNA gyrase subunit A
MGVTIFKVADGEHVVSVAKIDESEEVEVEASDEIAPEEGAIVGEDLAAGDEA